MTNEHFQDQLDSFLTNRLSGAEKASFEAQVATDPLLSNEVQLQKEIAEGLRNARKLALKQRLQNIDTSTIPAESNNLWTYAGMGASIGVVALAGLLFVNSGGDNSVKSNNSVPAIEQPVATGTQTEKSVPAQVEGISVPSENTKTTNQATVAKADKELHAAEKAKVNVSPVSPANPDFGNEPDVNEGGIKTGNSGAATSAGKLGVRDALNNLVDGVEVVKADKEYSNHYRYVNNKLYLYGDFDKNLYELLELNVSKGKKLYIYHNGLFAQVLPNETITKFVTITDPNLVVELNALKIKKSN